MTVSLSCEQKANFSIENLQVVFEEYERELTLKKKKSHLNLMHFDTTFGHFTDKYDLLNPLDSETMDYLKDHLNNKIILDLLETYQYVIQKYPQTPRLLSEWSAYFSNPEANFQIEEIRAYKTFSLLQHIGKKVNENQESLLFYLQASAFEANRLRSVYQDGVVNSHSAAKQREQSSKTGIEKALTKKQQREKIVAHYQKIKDVTASMTAKEFSETFSEEYDLSPSTIRNILSKPRKKT